MATGHDTVSRASGGRSESARPEARVLPLAGQGSLALDAGAVRGRIGAWAAALAPHERPPLDAAWRDAVLVGDAVVAFARATLGVTEQPLWSVDVVLLADGQELARWTGIRAPTLRRTVDTLVAAEVVDGVRQIGGERVVRVRPEMLNDAPVLAAVRWDVVRTRLGSADAPAARLIVRELARRTSAEARAQAHFVSASQRELADAVGYSKAAMRRHLDALVTAGLLVSRSRDRTNSWHRLQPAVFDGEAAEADVSEAAEAGDERTRAGKPSKGARPDLRLSRVAGASRPAVTTRTRDVDDTPALLAEVARVANAGSPALPPGAPAAAAPVHRPMAAALTLEVNGVRVAIPPGVELTLEQDDAGAVWYRAGAMRFGPVRFA